MSGVGVCGALVGGTAVGDAGDRVAGVAASAWAATIGNAARAWLEPAPSSRVGIIGTGVAVWLTVHDSSDTEHIKIMMAPAILDRMNNPLHRYQLKTQIMRANAPLGVIVG